MKLVVLATLVVGLGACRIEITAPEPAARPAGEGTASGEGFFARDDRGGRRPLTLRQLGARITRGPGTLRTHLTIEIAGPDDVRVEAVMRLPIPRGAAVTGATLWVDGRPMAAAFVERDRARQIYQSIVARRRDPALVTWAGPDAVAVSIFPVEPHKSRRLALDWVEPAAASVAVPILRDGARVVGRAAIEVDGRPTATDASGRIAIAAPAPGSLWAARAPGDPFQRILVRGVGQAGPLRVVIVAETSAALDAVGRGQARRALLDVLRALPASARVTLLAADWNASVIAEAVAPAEAEGALGRLDAVISAGALHLERALTDALARARRDNGAVLFVGSGLDPFPGDALRALLAAARAADLRLSIVSVGRAPEPLADAAAMTGGVVLEAGTIAATAPELVAALRPWAPRPALEARGLDGWRPLETSDGGTVWVGRAFEGPPRAGNAPPAATAEPSDLVALWDRARLSWSERGTEGRRGSGHDHAALAPLRALLVLENDAEYARYGLSAPMAVAEETETAAGQHAPARLKGGLYGPRSAGSGGGDSAAGNDASDVLAGLIGNQIGEAYGVGSLGLVGTGAGGRGTGEGTISLGNLGTISKGGSNSGYGRGDGSLGARRVRTPDVVPGGAAVRGALDKEIVRRIVRRHLNELRYCYERDVASHGGETGRILLRFTISPSGQVVSAEQERFSTVDPSVARCFEGAVRRWEFPQTTGGGSAIVSCPFTLIPTAGAAVTPPPALPSEAGRAPDTASEESLESLEILAGREPLGARVTRVCERLGLDRTPDPETAAWSIERRDADLPTVMLVARLLAAAERLPDAVRVLSERAPLAPQSIAAELRRLGATRDAEEVDALQKRKP